MDEQKLVTYAQLSQEFGITYSRTHLPRLEKAGKFPPRFKPFGTRGSRIWWWRHQIVAWLNGKWPT